MDGYFVRNGFLPKEKSSGCLTTLRQEAVAAFESNEAILKTRLRLSARKARP